MRPATRLSVLLGIVTLAACGRTTPTAPSPTPAADAPAVDAPAPAPAPTPTPPAPPPPPPTVAAPVVLVGAGDIARCGVEGAELTARLLDGIPGIVFTTGDNAYSSGTAEEFATCYDPTWGRHKARTRPAPGNHEYLTANAAPYFDYFGVNAGPWGRGYYSFTAGAWLVLSLNSNIPADAGSAQLAWIRDQLTTQPSQCVAVIWHHPLVSSGRYGRDPRMADVWRTLMEFNADVVLTGHDHTYERFAPLDDTGFPYPDGIRMFVVGTGGAPPYEFTTIQPGSEARIAAWGVLKLTLRSGAFDWEFVPVDAAGERDVGTQACR